MKTDQKVLARFLAAAIWADGEIDENETEFVGEIQETLELKNLISDVDDRLKKYKEMSEDDMADDLEKAAKKVDKGEKEGVLDLCLQMLCADAYLATVEIENYFTFADILGIDENTAEKAMDSFVEETEDLVVEE